MAAKKLEKQITKEILTFLQGIPGVWAVKVHGGPYSQGGLPDITGCFMGYRFDIEVKRPGCKPTPRQEAVMRKISAAGGTVFVAHSVDDVVAALGDDLRVLIYPGLNHTYTEKRG